MEMYKYGPTFCMIDGQDPSFLEVDFFVSCPKLRIKLLCLLLVVLAVGGPRDSAVDGSTSDNNILVFCIGNV